jgi:hypothetical protein
MKSYQQFLLSEGKIDATKFEGDLLAAMGSADPGSTNAKWPAPKNSKVPAVVLARGIVKKMQTDGVSLGKPGRTSGGSSKSDLTDLYLNMGAKSGEPKTDVQFGGMNLSVKQAGGAQIMAAQGPEAAAIIQASVKHIPGVSAEAAKLAMAAGDMVKEVLASPGFYDFRGGAVRPLELRARKKYGVDKVSELPDEERAKIQAMSKKVGAADKSLSRMLGIGSEPASKKDVEQFAGFAVKLGIAKKIAEGIPAFLGAESTKRGIFTEAATGKYKFKPKESIADHMFAWGTDLDNPAYGLETADQFINKVLSGGIKYQYNVRDRGGVGSEKGYGMIDAGATDKMINDKGRGGSIRFSIGKLPLDGVHMDESCMVDLDDGERQFITEMADELAEDHRTYLTENIEQIEMFLIQEGFFDKLTDLKKAAKSKISDYANKVRDAVTFVIDKLKEWIKFIGEWAMKLAKNPGVFMTLFQLDPQIRFNYNFISA